MERDSGTPERRSHGRPVGLFGRMVELAAENVNRLLGPFGHVDVRVQRRVVDAGPTAEQTRGLPAEVRADDERVTVVADLSDLPQADVDLACDGRTLTIAAADGRVREQVRLPVAVDADGATAAMRNGVVEVTLPRRNGGSGVVDV